MSLVFYAWGEVVFIFLLLASTVINYFLGLWVDRSEEPATRKLAVAVAVFVNIGLLAFFKYANFAVGHAEFAAASVRRGAGHRAAHSAAHRHFVLHLPCAVLRD